ncbi:acyl transferase [Bacteroidota bacterium]
MKDIKDIEKQIFNIRSFSDFNALSLEIFHYQYTNLPIYKAYIDGLCLNINTIRSIDQIPFLPIEFFRIHNVSCFPNSNELAFSSSTTTGSIPSKHFVHKAEIYRESILKGFTHFFGSPDKYHIVTLLPSYIERNNASLVFMADLLIEKSGSSKSGSYLYDHKKLIDTIRFLQKSEKKILLLGVTYALLDLAEKHPLKFSDIIILETGGMKGRRKEIVREEVHKILCMSFGVSLVYSEYGMTELLSQAYSKGNGIFETPPWMKVLTRDINDPFTFISAGETGGINIIDLANLYSCSFIATQDLGRLYENGSFEVLGRFDQSDVRGCNLMYK